MHGHTRGAKPEPDAASDAATALRSSLTSLLTNLELTHRHLARLPEALPLPPHEREALEDLTREAIRNAEDLRAQLRRPPRVRAPDADDAAQG